MNRPEPGFEIVEHTADLALRGWAADLPGLCAVMARALFEVIADTKTVLPRVTRQVRVAAETDEDLLHDWLEELNTLHQIRGEIYSRFTVRVEGGTLTAEVIGETLDPARHDLRIEIKAVTWHGLRVQRGPEGLDAYVLLDI